MPAWAVLLMRWYEMLCNEYEGEIKRTIVLKGDNVNLRVTIAPVHEVLDVGRNCNEEG